MNRREFLKLASSAAMAATLGGFATGTKNTSQWVIGEVGPELIVLPRGSRIFSPAETAAMIVEAHDFAGEWDKMRDMAKNLPTVSFSGAFDVLA
ncbi:MAG: twin-arginine translocation signal domain-containing protein [Candidatus Competibacteraceae bacterium]|nr:twin-arginine translocation signal domain-containing protein [Candidatus Competibacteraceae bacterium]